MNATISPKILDFLKNLKENNNREWFNDHKNHFTEAQQDFEFYIETLINELGKSDENIAKLNAKKSML